MSLAGNTFFNVITTKSLPGNVKGNAISWNPLVNLVAFVPEDECGVWAYRMNGQRVWSYASKKASSVTQVSWKNDNRTVGVIFQDGSWVVLNSANGKVLEEHGIEDNASFLNWFSMPAPTQELNVNIEQEQPPIVLEFNVLRHLPKLPPLPSANQHFTSVPLDGPPATTELRVVGSNTGHICLSVYGVFDIGKADSGVDGRVEQVVATNDVSEHVAMVRTNESLSLVIWKVDFIRKYGATYLSEVSLTPARLIALNAYIRDAIVAMETDTRQHLVQTKLAMAGLSDDKNLIQSKLFDTLITGRVLPDVRRFLTEHLGDRGIRKWHRACTTAYDTALQLLFENVIPGQERAIVLLSRLRGLALWRDRGQALGLDPDTLEDAIVAAQTLLKSAIDCLEGIRAERRMFNAFASWMEVTYNSVAQQTLSVKLSDDPSKVKTTDVSQFILNHLNKSDLTKYLGFGKETLRSHHKIQAEKCDLAFEPIKDAMRKQVAILNKFSVTQAGSLFKMRYCANTNYTYVLLAHADGPSASKVHILRYRPHSQSLPTLSVAAVSSGGPVLDMAFMDNSRFFILTQLEDKKRNRLLCANYASLLYNDISTENVEANINGMELQPIDVIEECEFEHKPVNIAISSRADRIVGVLLSQDKHRYTFFGWDESLDNVADAAKMEISD